MDVTVDFTRDFMYDLVCSIDDLIIGDLNNDSVINIQDIIIMINIILELDEYSIEADINEDGIINVLDVIQLINIILERS